MAGAGAMILFRLNLGVKLGEEQTISPATLLKTVIEIVDREVGRDAAVDMLETAQNFRARYTESDGRGLEKGLMALKEIAYAALKKKLSWKVRSPIL